MTPDLQSIFQQAIRYAQQADFSQAKQLLNYVLKIQPKNFDALHAMGFISGVENNHQDAVDYSLKALKINPNDLEVNINCAKALQEIGRHVDSVKYHQKAIALSPNNCEIWLGCGKSLQSLNHYDEAIAHYDKALKLNPDFAPAWSNKGDALNELKRYDEAIAHFDQALNLWPDFAPAWSNKGNTLKELKHYDEAIAHYDKALTLRPDYAEGWSNKAMALQDLKRYDEAITHFDKALSLKSNIDWIYGDLAHTKMKICNWSGLTTSLESISKKALANEKASQPFSLLALNDDALLHKKSSEIYTQSKYPLNTILGPIFKRSGTQKIRVGYFSADFHDHATGYLMAELFELHDRSRFELIGFSFGPIKNDGMRQRIEKSFDEFIEVGKMSDIEVAQLSRSLNIDIAIDLKGFTQDSRTGIFAYRAAPIQVNYLGYPGTMGADYIDYIIADKTLIPQESQSYYSEKVAYLHNSYQVNDRKRFISDRQFTRQELGLPEDEFVFCCFNNNFKILPATFDGWMRILKTVDRSVLWLFQENTWAIENLKKEAEKQGIAANRLLFAERLPLPEHLARHRQADLFLDTFPYNAHTTTSDALWAGLPVLTMMGESFASRVAGSLLNAIGLSELTTTSQAEYESLAIELANNTQKLASIKQSLGNNRLAAPLFDTPLFTKNLEAAYIKMYERYQSGLKPEHISII